MNLPDITDKLQLSNEFTLILIISANFLQSMFPCRFQHLLVNNMLVKHLFALLTMLFFVIFAGDRSSSPDFFRDTGKAIILYILFIVMTRNSFKVFIVILFLLGASFIIEIRIKDLDAKILDEKGTEEAKKKEIHYHRMVLRTINNIITYSALIIMFVGCFIYFGKKRIEYKKSFSIATFFIGKTKCRDWSPKGISTMESMRAALLGPR